MILWLYATKDIADTEHLDVLQNLLFLFDQQSSLIDSSLEVLALLSLILIFFLKPWCRRPGKVPISNT